MFNLDVDELAKIANDALNLGRAIAKKNYRQDFSVSLKSDLSPVTDVDIEIESTLKQYLNNKFPLAGFIGEETGVSDMNKEFFWCLDPIDGTRSFLSGYPIFCTLLGFWRGDSAILGMIDSPITNERWQAFGEEIYFNDTHIKINHRVKKLSDAKLAATTPAMFTGQQMLLFNRLSTKVKSTRWGGDAYNYGCLASGFLDIVVEADLKFHDLAALIPVIELSGGMITDWQGKRITSNNFKQVVATTNESLHNQALAILNP
ncbi:MAG: hypothetical protein JJV97_00285 [SAR324 cluster bacterium]|nr:hypothetical protein [SAR324 cluster bacterium]